MALLDDFFRTERNCHVNLSDLPLHPCTSVEPYVALLEPLCSTLKLLESLENGLCTYSVGSVWVSKVTCEVDLVRLNLLEKLDYDVDVGLCSLALLDTACLVEWKVKEVAVCLVVKTE